MLRHIVMWTFADQAEGRSKAENCRYIKERLEALPARIPQIRALEVLINDFPGPMASDMALVADFDSKEDLEAYTAHPDHRAVSEYVKKVRVSRSVVDSLGN